MSNKILKLKCWKCSHKWQEPTSAKIDGIACPECRAGSSQIEVRSMGVEE